MILTPHRRVVQFARAPAKRAGGHSHKNLLESDGYRGRVAQLGEHLLCKHAVISPKSLNRRLLTVQTPLQIGLLIGLRKIKYFVEVWTNTPKNELDSSERAPPETTTLACFSAIGRMRRHSDDKLCEK